MSLYINAENIYCIKPLGNKCMNDLTNKYNVHVFSSTFLPNSHCTCFPVLHFLINRYLYCHSCPKGLYRLMLCASFYPL